MKLRKSSFVVRFNPKHHVPLILVQKHSGDSFVKHRVQIIKQTCHMMSHDVIWHTQFWGFSPLKHTTALFMISRYSKAFRPHKCDIPFVKTFMSVNGTKVLNLLWTNTYTHVLLYHMTSCDTTTTFIMWHHVISYDITYRLSSSTLAFCSIPPPLAKAMSSNKLTVQAKMDLNTPWSAWCMRSGRQHIVGSKKGWFVQNGCCNASCDVIWYEMMSYDIPQRRKPALSALCRVHSLALWNQEAGQSPPALPRAALTRSNSSSVRGTPSSVVNSWKSGRHMMSYDIRWRHNMMQVAYLIYRDVAHIARLFSLATLH